MAIAISTGTVSRPSSQSQAATWSGISAAVALVATIPLFMMLTGPVSSVLFVRGTEHNGNWAYATATILIMLAPATYAIFFSAVGELLKTRVSALVHKSTMRIAAVGMVPYLVLAQLSFSWQSGPQFALIVVAGLSIPIAMAITIWASTQNH